MLIYARQTRDKREPHNAIRTIISGHTTAQVFADSRRDIRGLKTMPTGLAQVECQNIKLN